MKSKIVLDSSREFLLRMPVYTPTLIGFEDQNETALVMRVDNLSSFRKRDLPIGVKFSAWRSEKGVWVIAVAFRAIDNVADPLEGDAYLNPRQERDYNLLVRFTKQDRFPFAFLSQDLSQSVGKAISWPAQQRQEVSEAVRFIDLDLAGARLAGEFDSVFEQAKNEFQRLYSVQELLKSIP